MYKGDTMVYMNIDRTNNSCTNVTLWCIWSCDRTNNVLSWQSVAHYKPFQVVLRLQRVWISSKSWHLLIFAFINRFATSPFLIILITSLKMFYESLNLDWPLVFISLLVECGTKALISQYVDSKYYRIGQWRFQLS